MDDLLMRSGKADVRNDGGLLRRVQDRGALAKVEQQPLQGQSGHCAIGGFAIDVQVRRRIVVVNVLVAADSACREIGKVGAAGDARCESRLAGGIPGSPRQQIVRFGQVDELGERIGMRGIGIGRGRNACQCRVRRQRVTGSIAARRRRRLGAGNDFPVRRRRRAPRGDRAGREPYRSRRLRSLRASADRIAGTVSTLFALGRSMACAPFADGTFSGRGVGVQRLLESGKVHVDQGCQRP